MNFEIRLEGPATPFAEVESFGGEEGPPEEDEYRDESRKGDPISCAIYFI